MPLLYIWAFVACYRSKFTFTFTSYYKQQKSNERNPLYAVANTTKRHVIQLHTHCDSVHVTPAQYKHQHGVSSSLNKYIRQIHDIKSIHPYNNVHIYNSLYVQPQTHADFKRDCNSAKILLYFIVK